MKQKKGTYPMCRASAHKYHMHGAKLFHLNKQNKASFTYNRDTTSPKVLLIQNIYISYDAKLMFHLKTNNTFLFTQILLFRILLTMYSI